MYHCDDCHFSSNNKSDYHKHLSTIKHTLKTQEMKAAFPTIQVALVTKPPRPIEDGSLEEQPLKQRKSKTTTTVICEPIRKNCTENPSDLVDASDNNSAGTIFLVVIYIFIAINGTLLYMFYHVGF